MFRRIAIVNRGEAAMRLIHAVRDLNAERGHAERIETVALYTEGERTAMFVREADLSYALGPATERPYLDHGVLERALVETGADAAWVGWGFVAEDPAFADLCERIGVTFIGPSPEAMRKLGDKIGSKLIAEEVGVPVAPWSRGPVDTLEAATAAARDIGYPLMLKATAGGGGRGIRVVASDADLKDAYERTRDEAARAFGSGVVFLERLVTGARHVEVQVIADGQGTAWALGVRDCSVQRRNQKVIEESASPVLSAEQVDELKAAPSGSPSPSATAARAPSSSSTTRARSSSPSSRSTPGCRSSTRSPRSPPTSTSSRPRSTWPPVAASRVSARPSPATPSRPGSTPRTPTATSRRRPAGSRCSTCRRVPASGSTPVSARATRSLPTSTR